VACMCFVLHVLRSDITRENPVAPSCRFCTGLRVISTAKKLPKLHGVLLANFWCLCNFILRNLEALGVVRHPCSHYGSVYFSYIGNIAYWPQNS
jgi:hypothetical protein